jgi:hypothetical protein
MHPAKSIVVALTFAVVLMAGAGLAVMARAPVQGPLDPTRESGQGVTPAYEGWYRNADGTFTLLIGYFNRNRQQALDIPVGPDNRFEPGNPDQGQPTHFLPRRQWGVMTIVVPADFGTRRLNWSITANGETNTIPVWLNPSYEVMPFKDPANGNTPPALRFSESGPEFTGPPRGLAATLTASTGQTRPLTFWASDRGPVTAEGRGRGGPGVSVFVSKYRGPGGVKLDNARPAVAAETGRVTANATFDAPGDYILRVQANDSTGDGGGGFQCCWTNAHVRVAVK